MPSDIETHSLTAATLRTTFLFSHGLFSRDVVYMSY